MTFDLSSTSQIQWEDLNPTSSRSSGQSTSSISRRHSESNFLLMSRAMRGDFRIRRSTVSRNNSTSDDINSNTTSNYGTNVPGASVQLSGSGGESSNLHAPSLSGTAIDKLATMHTVLQSSALSMADLDSETF